MTQPSHTCFLSYAREDSDAARALYDDLCAAGATVWYDKESLVPGERFGPAIRKAIRSSRYFIALLSTRAVSKKGFVQREIREALAVIEEYPDDEVYLIPIRLDDCTPTHEALKALNWVDFFPTRRDGVNKLVRFL